MCEEAGFFTRASVPCPHAPVSCLRAPGSARVCPCSCVSVRLRAPSRVPARTRVRVRPCPARTRRRRPAKAVFLTYILNSEKAGASARCGMSNVRAKGRTTAGSFAAREVGRARRLGCVGCRTITQACSHGKPLDRALRLQAEDKAPRPRVRALGRPDASVVVRPVRTRPVRARRERSSMKRERFFAKTALPTAVRFGTRCVLLAEKIGVRFILDFAPENTRFRYVLVAFWPLL